jgi:hypothetical protein
VEVTDASMGEGLLVIALKREIPEALKPRSIPINGGTFMRRRYQRLNVIAPGEKRKLPGEGPSCNAPVEIDLLGLLLDAATHRQPVRFLDDLNVFLTEACDGQYDPVLILANLLDVVGRISTVIALQRTGQDAGKLVEADARPEQGGKIQGRHKTQGLGVYRAWPFYFLFIRCRSHTNKSAPAVAFVRQRRRLDVSDEIDPRMCTLAVL